MTTNYFLKNMVSMLIVCGLGKSIDKKCEGSSTKIFGTTVKTTPVMNNNLAVTPALSTSPEDSKSSSLLKKVSYLIILLQDIYYIFF